MGPIFVFIALPALSVALLLAILLRRLRMALASEHGQQRALRRAMSRPEALQLLGLDNEADMIAIRAAYKRLIVKYHPDHGGSDNVAARLNMARDTLLRAQERVA